MKSSYPIETFSVFLLMNGALAYGLHMLSSSGLQGMNQRFVNPVMALFCFFQAVFFLLLTMMTPSIAKEKLLGNIENLMAYGVPFSSLVQSKALFVSLLSFFEYPILVVTVWIYIITSGQNQVFESTSWVELALAFLTFPLLVYLSAFANTMITFLNARLSYLCQFFWFAITVSVFSALKTVTAILSETKGLYLVLMIAVSVILILFLHFVAERIRPEMVLK